MPDLTVDQAAVQMNHSHAMVRKLANRGKLPGAYKAGMGGKTSPWRIPAKAIEMYRKSQPQGYRP